MRYLSIIAAIYLSSGCTLLNTQEERATYSEIIDNIAQAERLIEQGEFETSYLLLNNAMNSEFQGAYLYDVYAQYYERLGDHYLSELASSIKSKKQSKSNFYLQMSKKAIHLYREYKKGQTLASLSLKYDHSSKDALTLLAGVSYAINDLEVVSKVVREMEKQNITDSKSLLIRYLLSKMNNNDDADRYLQQIVTQFPNSEEALHIRRKTIDKSVFVAMRIGYLEKQARIKEKGINQPFNEGVRVSVSSNTLNQSNSVKN